MTAESELRGLLDEASASPRFLTDDLQAQVDTLRRRLRLNPPSAPPVGSADTSPAGGGGAMAVRACSSPVPTGEVAAKRTEGAQRPPPIPDHPFRGSG